MHYKYKRKSKCTHLDLHLQLFGRKHGKSTSEVVFTTMEEQRFRMQARVHYSPLEFTIKPNIKYVKNLWRFVEKADMGGMPRSQYDKNRLINKVLAVTFSLLLGLNIRKKIWIAIYLPECMIRQLGEIGYTVRRMVADNLTTNVKMFKEMNGRVFHPFIQHPVQPAVISKYSMMLGPIFLCFDPVNGIKKVRNQFRDRILMDRGDEVRALFPQVSHTGNDRKHRKTGSSEKVYKSILQMWTVRKIFQI